MSPTSRESRRTSTNTLVHAGTSRSSNSRATNTRSTHLQRLLPVQRAVRANKGEMERKDNLLQAGHGKNRSDIGSQLRMARGDNVGCRGLNKDRERGLMPGN